MPSRQFEVIFDCSIVKNLLEEAEISAEVNSSINFDEKKKMQMTIEKHEYYRKQVKFYILKVWGQNKDSQLKKSIVKKSENEKKEGANPLENVVFDDTGSVGSMNSQSVNKEPQNENQNYTKSVNDIKSSFMQSESTSDPAITAFERIIYFIIIPFFSLLIIDYVMFIIQVFIF